MFFRGDQSSISAKTVTLVRTTACMRSYNPAASSWPFYGLERVSRDGILTVRYTNNTEQNKYQYHLRCNSNFRAVFGILRLEQKFGQLCRLLRSHSWFWCAQHPCVHRPLVHRPARRFCRMLCNHSENSKRCIVQPYVSRRTSSTVRYSTSSEYSRVSHSASVFFCFQS